MYDGFLSYSVLNTHVNNLDSQGIGIIINACHSGSAIPILSNPGRVIVTSCRATETSGDFSEYLFNGLVGFADKNNDIGNQNGIISLEETYNHLMSNWDISCHTPQIQDDYSGDLEIVEYGSSNEKIDQYSELVNDYSPIYLGSDENAQSFRPSQSVLTKIKLLMSHVSNTNYPLKISIRSDLYGADLTSVTLSSDDILDYVGYHVFDFPDISVNIGEIYYIICKTLNQPSNPQYTFYQERMNYYNNGNTFISEDNGQSWDVINPLDILFITYGYGINNNVPVEPYSPSPSDKTEGVDTNVLLSWSCEDPENNPLSFDIYFGKDAFPDADDLKLQDQTNKFFNTGALEYGTQYFWKIIAKDSNDLVSESPIWSFTTEVSQSDILDQEQTEGGAEWNINAALTLAQSFKPSLDVLSKIKVLLKKQSGDSSNLIYISIRETIDGDDLTTISLNAEQISFDYSWKEFDIPDISVNVDETYYIIIEIPTNNNNHIKIKASGSNSYSEGSTWMYWPMMNTWQEQTNVDITFKTYSTNGIVNSPPVIPVDPSPGHNELISKPSFADADVNGDGEVSILDVYLVGQHFGETGSPGWIVEDVDDDGVVDRIDTSVVYWHILGGDGPPIFQEIFVSDPDGDSLTVGFYWSDGSLIDENVDVPSDSVSWVGSSSALDPGSYGWYVVVDDGVNPAVQSGIFSFTIVSEGVNSPPVIPVDPSPGHNELISKPSFADADVNGDGEVSILDVYLVGQHFGETGSPGWIVEDVDDDGVVDRIDTSVVYWHILGGDGPPIFQEIFVSDPDGDSLTVGFYWSDGSLIDENVDVPSDSVSWVGSSSALDPGSYGWYVVVDDGVNPAVQSGIFSFTIKDDEQQYYDLTIEIVGNGDTNPPLGVHSYINGEQVTVEALENDNAWSFSRWEGAASGTNTQTTITMNRDKTVTAVFEENGPIYYTLSTNVIGSGSISPPGGSYEKDSIVTLTASPSSGWSFSRWEDAASGTNPQTIVNMDSDKTVTAVFTEDQQGLEIKIEDLNIAELKFKIISHESETQYNLQWDLKIEGGILGGVNVSENGNINNLDPGSTEELTIDDFGFGLGLVQIIVELTVNGETITKEENGIILGKAILML